MSYRANIQGFEGQRIELVPPGILSGPKLLVDGRPAWKGPNKGQMVLRTDDGREVLATWRQRYLGFDVPQLEVEGRLILFTEPVKWYEFVWSGIPLFLLFLGNVVGVVLGFACFPLNVRVFQSRRGTLFKFLITGLLSVLSIVATLGMDILVTGGFWHLYDFLPAVGSISLRCVGWSISLLIIVGLGLAVTIRATNSNTGVQIIGIPMFGLLVLCCLGTWIWIGSTEPAAPFWKPANQDIAGTYALDQRSVKELEKIGYPHVRLVISISFNEDGTFMSTDLPDMFWLGGMGKQQQQSRSGTWKISKNADGRWLLDLRFANLDDKNMNEGMVLYLSGDKPPYTIYESLGETNALVFERQ